ncbi:AsmA family protein [Kordiimonas laminariae]|uniref:AsmA family protein n=1 Tax=Kordiimonas laminariae TaxID=2917717 RepID=UPI001FF1A23D|nr:AsmA family protein [Kordiimonas laminariae]
MKHSWPLKMLYGFLGGVLIALVGISVALNFLDWNEYREEMSAIASDQLDMQVDLAGDVSFALFPRPSVSLETISLAPNTEGFSESVATAERIQMRLGFSSLFKGEVAIQSLSLDGVSVTLAETEGGAWKVKGWPVAENPESANVNMAFERMGISGGALVLEHQSGEKRTLENIKFDIEGSLPRGPLDWVGGFSSNGQVIEASGRMRPVSVRDEVSLKTDITVGGSTLEVAGRISGTGDVTGRVIMSGSELQTVLSALALAAGSSDVSAPNLPFAFDVQLEKQGDITKLVSRELMVGDTRGRLDVTVADRRGMQHVTGNVALGVIDADAWIKSLVSVPVNSNEVQPQASTDGIIRGALDFTIEGVKLGSGIGQRVDAVLSFSEDGASITSMQALLPGATSFTFAGALNAKNGGGTIALNSGNLKGLMVWLNLEAPAELTAGRLAAAKLNTKLSLNNGSWTLDDITGEIDTTKFTGGISGKVSSPVPTQFLLRLEELNLDSYLIETSGDKSDEEFQFPNLETAVDLEIKELLYKGAVLEKVKITAVVSENKVEVSHAGAEQLGATFITNGGAALIGNQIEINLNGEMIAWPILQGSFLSSDYKSQARALGFQLVSGKISLSGPMDNMRLGLDIGNGADKLLLTGQLGISGGAVTDYNLQGSINHRNIADFAQLISDDLDWNNVPVELALDLEKKAASEEVGFKIGGSAAGARLTLEGNRGAENTSAQITVNHDRAGTLLSSLGIEASVLNAAENLLVDMAYNDKAGDISISVNEVRNGQGLLKGQFSLSSAKVLQGQGIIENWSVNSLTEGQSNGAPTKLDLSNFGSYVGTIGLSLKNLTIFGQRLEANDVSIALGDATAQLQFGRGATLNGKPLSGNLTAVLEGEQRFNGTLNTDGIALDRYLKSQGYKVFASSTIKGGLEFSGALNAGKPVAATLSATGDFSGEGGALEFIGVPNLVAQMQSAKSSRGFLNNIGGLLRTGSTPLDVLNAKFTMDSGVMLLEQANASGSWGKFNIDGQLNFVSEFMSLKGQLELTQPKDTPTIPVNYQGAFNNPNAQWESRLFERFVIAGIERRLRSALFKEREAAGDGKQQTPGAAVFSRAFGLLGALQKAQEKKREEERKKQEAAKAASQETEGQKP